MMTSSKSPTSAKAVRFKNAPGEVIKKAYSTAPHSKARCDHFCIGLYCF